MLFKPSVANTPQIKYIGTGPDREAMIQRA